MAYDNGIVPSEKFACAKVSAVEGTMIKILHNDIFRTIHILATVASVDLSNFQ